MKRALDVIDTAAEPATAYLPFDPPHMTIWLLESGFAAQLRQQRCPSDMVAAVARRGALELFAAGWRSSEGILHQVDNPIPAPQPPNLPSPAALRRVA